MEKKENLSKRNAAVITAYENGYRIIDGIIYNPKGHPVAGSYKYPFHYHEFGLKYGKKSVGVMVHKLVAYQKFGSAMFEPGIVVRHLNGNSLDNSKDNIEIGTALQNTMDRSPQSRREHAIKASAHVRKFKDENLLREFLTDRANGVTYSKLIQKYNLSKSTISYLLNKVDYVKEFANREGINFQK